jgi:hypothetical protein
MPHPSHFSLTVWIFELQTGQHMERIILGIL